MTPVCATALSFFEEPRSWGKNIDDILSWYDGLVREVKAVIEFAARSLDANIG